MVVPKKHLIQFFGLYGSGEKKYNMLMMVTKDLTAHMDDVSIRDHATAFMYSVLKGTDVETRLLVLILKSAWELKHDELYHRAI